MLASGVTAGGLGVDLFFCLSSFLITMLLVREFDLRGTIDVRAFWIRRILRIWPLYYCFIGFAALLVPFFMHGNHLRGFHLLGYLFLGGNWVCVTNGYPPSIAAPLWSVSIEEQFYLLWPLLLSIFSCRRLPHLAIGCLLIASVMRVVAVHMELPHPGIWCNTFARLDPIALGALFAVFNHHRSYSISNAMRALLLSLGVILPPILIFLFGDSCFSGPASIFFYPAVAICCVFILTSFYRNIDKSTRSRSNKMSVILIYFGRISYGLYVFHVFGITVSRWLIAGGGAHSFVFKAVLQVGQFLFAFGLTVGLAAASYSLLEKPFLRLKERFTYVESSPATKINNHIGTLRR